MHGLINEEIDFHTIKIDEPFGVWFHFWKIFGNQCRLVWRSYSWSNMTWLYTFHVEFETLRVFMRMYMMVTCVPTKRWTLTLPKFDEPFGVRFHFEKILWRNRRRLMWGSYFWLRTTWLYTQWLQMYQRKDGLSHYWKFDEPFGARFHFEKILRGNRCRLMWGSYFWLRTTWLYTQWLQIYPRKDGLSHYWKFDEPFGARFHFEIFF